MGCRKFKGEAYFDDLSDEPRLPEELERVVFVFDGEALELDLDDDNAAMFRQAMSPFVRAARKTSKAAVLATLPRKRRHLTVVPSPAVMPVSEETAPQGAPFPQTDPDSGSGCEDSTLEGRFPLEGNDTDGLTGSEGPPVPETSPDVSESRVPEPAKPALSLVPDEKTKRAWDQWAAFAPEARDDKADRMLKARQWAGALLVELPDGKVTPEILVQWEEFYRERRWARLS